MSDEMMRQFANKANEDLVFETAMKQVRFDHEFYSPNDLPTIIGSKIPLKHYKSIRRGIRIRQSKAGMGHMTDEKLIEILNEWGITIEEESDE